MSGQHGAADARLRPFQAEKPLILDRRDRNYERPETPHTDAGSCLPEHETLSEPLSRREI